MDATILGAWITGGIACIVAVGTLLWQRWQGKEIERVKSQLQQYDFIHRLQFEKEFGIYSDLWKLIVELSDHMARFTNNAPRTNELSEITTGALHLFDRMEKFRDFVETHKPFFSEQIYDEVQKMTSVLGETIKFGAAIHLGNDQSELPVRLERIGKDLKTISDNVCIAIRNRITVQNHD